MGSLPLKSLSLLILGGTGFIGPHQLQYALDRGHRITVFNRGTHPGALPSGIEALLGDRDRNDYASLAGHRFDVCIDNACSVPHWVRDTAAVLSGNVGHYIFVSTVSVYSDNSTPHQDESAQRQAHDRPDPMTISLAGLRSDMALYGPLKARCEDEVRNRYPGIATIVRPGLIVGPGDDTDRFTYWPVRIAQGGDVLTPPHHDAVQLIDVRDLAEWTVRLAETGTTGTLNAVGPDHSLTMGAMLDTIRTVAQSDARWHEASSAFLSEQGVSAWQDLPVWIPGDDDSRGFHRRSNAQAIDAGLRFRSLADTVESTLQWWNSLPEARKITLKTGLAHHRERELLSRLKHQSVG